MKGLKVFIEKLSLAEGAGAVTSKTNNLVQVIYGYAKAIASFVVIVPVQDMVLRAGKLDNVLNWVFKVRGKKPGKPFYPGITTPGQRIEELDPVLRAKVLEGFEAAGIAATGKRVVEFCQSYSIEVRLVDVAHEGASLRPSFDQAAFVAGSGYDEHGDLVEEVEVKLEL